MTKIQAKRYTVDSRKNIFSKDYETVNSETGDVFPTNRIVADVVEYSWTYENQNKENIEYSWEKIEIINFKLTLEDWKPIKRKKTVWNYIKDDKTTVSMSKEQFEDLINWVEQ